MASPLVPVAERHAKPQSAPVIGPTGPPDCQRALLTGLVVAAVVVVVVVVVGVIVMCMRA